MIITIDGPANSGKSTVAQLVAEQLGYLYINSGYLYRAFAYLLVSRGSVVPEMLAVITMQGIAEKIAIDLLHYTVVDGEPQLFYGEENITPFLKTGSAIDTYASYVSLNAAVRSMILHYLRYRAGMQDVVIDGRDTGTVVFPDAACKIFLTASLAVRAERSVLMLANQGITISLAEAEKTLALRDERDTTREIAPLVIPHGALIIDSTHLTIQQVVRVIIAYHHDIAAR